MPNRFRFVVERHEAIVRWSPRFLLVALVSVFGASQNRMTRNDELKNETARKEKRDQRNFHLVIRYARVATGLEDEMPTSVRALH